MPPQPEDTGGSKEREQHNRKLSAHADALVALAEVEELSGREGEAMVAADEAVRLYELKGNVVSANRVQPRLAANAGTPGGGGTAPSLPA